MLIAAGLARETNAADTAVLRAMTLAPAGDFYIIRLNDTGQPVAQIGPDVWQGNANRFPIDPTVTDPAQHDKMIGTYWSQFLMMAQGWLTDRVESAGGEHLTNFHVIRPAGTLIEYEGAWRFNDQVDLVTPIF